MTIYFYDTLHREITEENVKLLLKFFAYTFHCFVSIHPFSDGNGRTARLLVCLLHFLILPLPLSVYNWYSPTTSTDFLMALDDARVDLGGGMFDEHIKPSELATMILVNEFCMLRELEKYPNKFCNLC
jgi:fido (protein-threonine AMPylation protein)